MKQMFTAIITALLLMSANTVYAFENPAYSAPATVTYINAYDYIISDIYANSGLSRYIALQFINHAEEFSLSGFPEAADVNILIDALCEAYYQNNAYIGGIELNQIMFDFSSLTIRIPYALTGEEQKQLQEYVITKANTVTGQIIAPGMSDFQKSEAINNYLCQTSEYDQTAKEALLSMPRGKMISDTHKYSQTAYGVLADGLGICQSFAEAFKVLASRAGLKSIVVTGVINGIGGHEWNRVYIDGQWYTLDVSNNANLHMNKFLNISDEIAQIYFTEDNRHVLDSELYRFKAIGI